MTTWAVLIGIDFYVNQRNLKGAVQDVKDMELYLKAHHKAVNSSCFMASAPQDSNEKFPAEERSTWPTYQNIIKKLQEIEQTSNQGDFLYIHYSGHGAQEPTTSPQYKERGSSDIAVVLFDADNGERYLRGFDLARLLQKFANKGLKVTVVLDCCYSGSVMRGGNLLKMDVRGVDWDPAIDAAHPSKHVPYAPKWVLPITRNARWSFKWLENPRDYTLITACGPHEVTWEGEFDGVKHGILSYLLISALNIIVKSGCHISHESVYGYLCAHCHADYPKQNPMLLGNRAVSFLGDFHSSTSDQTEVLKASDGSICLRIGRAQGVHEDDEYDIYPFDSITDIQCPAQIVSARVKVTTVRGLTSDVAVIQAPLNGEEIITGWKARPLMHFSARKAHIKIVSHLNDRDDWKFAVGSSKLLHLFSEDVEGSPCVYEIYMNDREEYEILDSLGQRVINVPTMSATATEAKTRVVQNLEHIAKFKFIEALENRFVSRSLENAFSINISNSQKYPLDTVGVLEIPADETLIFTFRNISQDSLYLTFYNLTPLWQVQGISSSGGGADYWVIQPQDPAKKHSGVKNISIQMLIPEEIKQRGIMQCDDVIKLFVTTWPTSFKALNLPKIQMHNGTPMRGQPDDLSKFLATLAMPHRGTNEERLFEENWATRNYIIRTIAKNAEYV